jgi:predicted Zn-dependent protease with MMP-like domain
VRLALNEVEELVAVALDELPEEFAALLDNVAVVVEEEPSDDDLESVGMDPDDPEEGELLGIYQGMPLTERDTFYAGMLPDRIAIFAGPIRRCCESRREAIDEIKKTVIHELGHYFGMEEEDMPY